MDKTHFVKVSAHMSWDTLREKISEQEKVHAKPLSFVIIVTIHTTSTRFDSLSHCIRKSNALYMPYASLSVADSKGTWRCISIKCKGDPRNILIYTAGTAYPLYASIL